MTPAEIQEERQAAMTIDELRSQKERLGALYDFAIDTRKRFDRIMAEQGWNEAEAEERMSSLIFGDGTDGSDEGVLS